MPKLKLAGLYQSGKVVHPKVSRINASPTITTAGQVIKAISQAIHTFDPRFCFEFAKDLKNSIFVNKRMLKTYPVMNQSDFHNPSHCTSPLSKIEPKPAKIRAVVERRIKGKQM